MFNEYFNLRLYTYILGIPILVLLFMLSLRYYTLKYEPTFDEMSQFINHSILRVLTSKIEARKIYNYFSNRYDMSFSSVRLTRAISILPAILIEAAILQILLDATDFDQKLPPTIFWGGLYLVSFIVCWRFGSRLKNYVKD
jgi:hypothetical protein